MPFVSIDVWTMIFTWVNLLILYLLLKRFLFAPVQNVIAKRAEEAHSIERQAQNALSEANQLQASWKEKLADAHQQADSLLSEANESARRQAEALLAEGQEHAQELVSKANRRIEREKKEAEADLTAQAASLATAIASKILGDTITAEADEKMIAQALTELKKGDSYE